MMDKKIKIKKEKSQKNVEGVDWAKSRHGRGGRAVEEGDKVSLKKIDKNKRRLNVDKNLRRVQNCTYVFENH